MSNNLIIKKIKDSKLRKFGSGTKVNRSKREKVSP